MAHKILIVFLLFVCSFNNTNAQNNIFNKEKLDSFLTILELNNKTMGSVSIAKDGKIIYQKALGYGLISETSKKIATAETPYHIGSITKMFTAVLIFKLIDEGKLTLETKLSKYFPEIKNSDDITIKELLNHKSGLFDFVNDNKDVSWITKPRTKAEIIDFIKKNKPNSKPNKNLRYSNSGFLFLGYIIETITGKSYQEVLQEKICNRLGLLHTNAALSNQQQNDMAIPYQYEKEWKEITDIYFTNVIGVGDITSTPNDLIVFNEALMNGKLVSESNLQLMKPVQNESFGMGMMRVPFDDKQAFGHGGDTYGTHSIVATFEKEKMSLAMCINGEVFPHNDIAIGILNIYFGENFEIPQFNNITYTSEDLDKFLGKYTSDDLPLKITITKENSTLMAQASGQNAFPMEVTGNNQFSYFEAGIKIEFFPDKNEFILHQGGAKFLYKKNEK